MALNPPNTSSEVLAWLHDYAYRVTFQDLTAGVLRQKNRVIVEFRCENGAIEATGARSLSMAVAKAALLRTVKSKAQEVRANANL